MTQLQTHSNFESVINPDDKKLSADHNQNRLQEISELATARITENSNIEGLEGYFAGFENSSYLPWQLAEQVQRRVSLILSNVGDDTEIANNGSSASTLDTGLWRYRKAGVLDRIRGVRNAAETSLTVVEGYKEALKKAQAGAMEQFEDMKSRQAEIIEKRGWWRKAANKMAKIGTFGAYSLIEKKKRQAFFNKRFEKKMNERFENLNRNLAKVEKESTTRKARMKSHMERVLKSAHDPARKSLLKSELIAAVQHTGAIPLNLPNWTNFAGGTGINDEQEKVDFLEAAKELDFVKNDLAAIGISKAKNAEQKEMIKSAQDQQKIMIDDSNFKFEDVKNLDPEFKDLNPAENAPKTSDLVRKIENQLQGNGIDVENKIYRAAGDVKKSNLMVDSAKLVLLIKAIKGNTEGSKTSINKSVKIKQEILAWINKVDGETGGKILEWTSTSKDEVKKIQDLFIVGGTDSLVDETSSLLEEINRLNIASSKTAIKKVKDDSVTLSGNIFAKKQAFENLLNILDNFPNKDKKDIEDAFSKIESIREKLIKVTTKWEKDKEGKLSQNNITAGAKDILDDMESTLSTEKAKPVPTNAVAAATHAKIIANLQSERNRAHKNYLEEKNKNVYLSNFASELVKIQGEISSLGSKVMHLTNEVSPSIPSLNQRIQNEMATETFAEEIDKKFVEEMSRNDQYENLKTVSEGTKVKIWYKEVGGTTNLRFPNQLSGGVGTGGAEFTVIRKDDKAIHLESGNKVITIVSAAAEGSTAYKNALVRKKSGTTYNPLNPIVGGAGEHAIVYNMRIAA